MLIAVPILEELRQLVKKDVRPDRQIAIASGIHPVTFCEFMAGRRGLSVETAEKLATALNHPLNLTPPKKR